MNIQLKLKNFCVQTAARRMYEHNISSYFKQKLPSNDLNITNLEKKIDNLKYFLENADFSQIRSKYKELSGKKQIDITLRISEKSDNWQFQFCNQTVSVIWKNKNENSTEKK